MDGSQIKSINEAVINRMLKYMGEQKLTQYALAHKSNLPLSTVKSIMQRRSKGIELKTMILLADGLGITPSEFINDPSFFDRESQYLIIIITKSVFCATLFHAHK